MKIICIGRNYTAHIEELKNEKPVDPVVFIKPDSSVLPKEQDFYIPEFSNDIHYEVEVLVKIKKVGKHIETKFAPNYYDEIGLGIDFTARDLQEKCKTKGLPWEIAKAFDYSAPIGDIFVHKSELGDLNNISFKLIKNGEVAQIGNTKDMIFNFDNIISYVSQFVTLKIGDLIFTGTLAGVAKVSIVDKLEGFLEEQKVLTLNIK